MAAIYPDLAGKVVLSPVVHRGSAQRSPRHFARQKSTVVFFDIKTRPGVRVWRGSCPAKGSPHIFSTLT